MTDGGDGLQNPSEETRRKIAISSYNGPNSKKILCYDKDGKFIKEYPNARRASEELNISHKLISKSIVNKSFTYNYTFFFINESNIQENLKERILNKSKTGESFLQVDNLGNIKEYNNIIEASRECKCNFRNIWLCLNNKRNNAGGYGWCYKELYDGNYMKYFTKKYSSKKIYSTLLDETFSSSIEASKKMGINNVTLCHYLKGKKIPKNGDKWIYLT